MCIRDRNEESPPRVEGSRCVGQKTQLGGGRSGRLGIDAHLVARLALVLELHDAVDERVDRVVRAEADVLSRVPLRAALPDDDVAGDDARISWHIKRASARLA